jgi:hypothetical protein
MFTVLEVDTGEAASETVFDSAKAANAYAEKARAETGKRYRIKRIVLNDAWKQREAERLVNGSYKPLPEAWINANWYRESEKVRDHFAHVSQIDGTKIAYTQSPENGERDIQTVCKASTYLARYFGDTLAPHEISHFAALLGEDIQLNICDKPETFSRIYREAEGVNNENSGSRSCMAKQFSALEYHPAYVMGGGDLAIAWLESDNVIVARAIVRPERKTFVRLYATEQRYQVKLLDKLQEQGYVRAFSFCGARLLRVIIEDDCVLLPYIDGETQNVEDCGDVLRISESGDIDGAQSDTMSKGYVSLESGRVTCECCGYRVSEDETQYVSERFYCDSCAANETFYCEYYHETYTNDVESVEVVIRRSGRIATWCNDAADHHAFLCDHAGCYYDDSVFSPVEVIVDRHGNTETWCNEECVDDYFVCENCHQVFAIGLMNSHCADTCEDCARELRRARLLEIASNTLACAALRRAA